MKTAFLHPNLNHNSCPILALTHPLLMSTKVTLVSHGALGTSELYQRWQRFKAQHHTKGSPWMTAQMPLHTTEDFTPHGAHRQPDKTRQAQMPYLPPRRSSEKPPAEQRWLQKTLSFCSQHFSSFHASSSCAASPSHTGPISSAAEPSVSGLPAAFPAWAPCPAAAARSGGPRGHPWLLPREGSGRMSQWEGMSHHRSSGWQPPAAIPAS